MTLTSLLYLRLSVRPSFYLCTSMCIRIALSDSRSLKALVDETYYRNTPEWVSNPETGNATHHSVHFLYPPGASIYHIEREWVYLIIYLSCSSRYHPIARTIQKTGDTLQIYGSS